MKWLIVLLAVPAVATAACKEGYIPTDVPGVCMKSVPSATNPAWVSDEKPSFHPQPAYERGDVTIVDAPNLEAQDRKWAEEKKAADKEGKKKAGIIY